MKFRFAVKELPKEENAKWIRISKVGRLKLRKKQGEKINIRRNKFSYDLEIHQGLKKDSRNMVVRLSPTVIQKLGLSAGDIIEIEGRGKEYTKKGKPEICILTLDCSESMRGTKFQRTKAAAAEFLRVKSKLYDGDIVGCVGFDENAYVIFNPTEDYKKATGQLEKLDLHLGTDIGNALDIAREMILGPKGKKKIKKPGFARHIVLLADGRGHPHHPITAAQTCKEANIVIDVIGLVDSKEEENFLRRIAEITGGKYQSIDSKSLHKLARLFRDISEKKQL